MPRSYYGNYAYMSQNDRTPIPKPNDIWNCRSRSKYKGCVKCPLYYGVKVEHIPGMEEEVMRERNRTSFSFAARSFTEHTRLPIKRCQNSWYVSVKPQHTKGWYEERNDR